VSAGHQGHHGAPGPFAGTAFDDHPNAGAALAPKPGLPFGEALAALKCGRRVAREGWNGKGLWLYFVPAATYNAMTDAARDHIGDVVPYNAYLALVSGGKVSTWAPSINDALAEDWFVLPEPVPEWNGCNRAEPAPTPEEVAAFEYRQAWLAQQRAHKRQDELEQALEDGRRELSDLAATLSDKARDVLVLARGNRP